MKKTTDFEKIAHLIPLRVTGDLSSDEAQLVDQTIRYDEQSRSEMQSYQHLMGVLQEAAAGAVRNESSVVRGERSLWERIEPQLGPVARPRPKLFERIPTGYLAIACGLLLCVTALTEFREPLQQALPVAVTQGWGAGGVQTVGNAPNAGLTPVLGGQPQGNLRVKVAIPISSESVGIPNLGLVVTRVERLGQRLVGLQDLNAVLITDITPDSLADRCGLQKGDCLIRVGQQRIYAPLHAVEVLNEELADGSTSFEVIRSGQRMSISVEGNSDADQSARPGVGAPASADRSLSV